MFSTATEPGQRGGGASHHLPVNIAHAQRWATGSPWPARAGLSTDEAALVCTPTLARVEILLIGHPAGGNRTGVASAPPRAPCWASPPTRAHR